jgi:GNAT superfamily N-acetyltransferase
MSWEIAAYKESLVEELIGVFNRETVQDEFVVPLTPAIWSAQISSKPLFSPDGCFLALEHGRAIGFALTSPGVDDKRQVADPGVGVVDGLFFPQDRLEVGDALLARCMEYFQTRGTVKTVYGFASFGGYPYWRGLYCGAEPVCLTHYHHAWIAFMAQGFTHHQQSINYLGTPEQRAYRQDLDYIESDLCLSSQWASQSWKGHQPKVITVYKEGEPMGYIGHVHLPFLSEHRQKSAAGIYGMQVYAPFRRQGIATSMINYLFDRAHERGVQEILVGTTVENRAARRTYEKGGMRPIAFRTGTVYKCPR